MSSAAVAGPLVVVTGREDLEAVLTAVRLAQSRRSRNGLPDNPTYTRLAATLSQAMSACPRSDRPKPAVAQTDSSRWLTIREAAEMMGYSERHARRLAERGLLDGEFSAGRWHIPEAAIVEHMKGMNR